jgi:hypothetical protein
MYRYLLRILGYRQLQAWQDAACTIPAARDGDPVRVAMALPWPPPVGGQ